MDTDMLDSMPLEVLLALRDALADPTEAGRVRAAQRAADAGFYLSCLNEVEEVVDPTPRVDLRPIAMEPAPDDFEGVALEFQA